MKIEILVTRSFERDVKRLVKRDDRLIESLQELRIQLEAGETPGDQVPGVGYPVYKVRVGIKGRVGKSGGYRVCYYLWNEDRRLFIRIYSKNVKENIDPQELRRLIREFLKE